MIVHKLQDADGNTASAHINTQGEAVLVVEDPNDYSIGLFIFESVDEIDFLINQLNNLKNNFNG